MLASQILRKCGIIATLLLVIFVTSCDLIDIDWGYDTDDYDYVPGRSCQTNSDCAPSTKYCCLIQNPKFKWGSCNYRGVQGWKCSNKLYRTVENNNYEAPYLYFCPCVQPDYSCHREHGLADVGTCVPYGPVKRG
nr:uncharacterized protein LOC126527318 [Dermacentor andersoni]